MADEKTILSYKGRPLMRKDNLVYYGSMADSHIVMLQILETKKVGDADVASKVSVELQPVSYTHLRCIRWRDGCKIKLL